MGIDKDSDHERPRGAVSKRWLAALAFIPCASVASANIPLPTAFTLPPHLAAGLGIFCISFVGVVAIEALYEVVSRHTKRMEGVGDSFWENATKAIAKGKEKQRKPK